jgi:hypothetical protein
MIQEMKDQQLIFPKGKKPKMKKLSERAASFVVGEGVYFS